MMCSNAAAQAQLFPFLRRRPPVVVDWQPWHHCGGSSHNFHAALANGGSYYIDRGKPTTEAAFAPTLHALRSISPTLHFNVPLGYDRLVFPSGAGRSTRPQLLRRTRLYRVLRRLDAAHAVGGAGAAVHRPPGSAGADGVLLRHDGDGAAAHQPALARGRARHDRAADPRLLGEAGAGGRQAGAARQRTERHAGLPQRARPDGGGVRCGGLVSQRRCGAPGGCGAARARTALRRQADRPVQARQRKLGARSARSAPPSSPPARRCWTTCWWRAKGAPKWACC